jgi:glycosyltransferase involved in cell wall biosynthesis
MHLPYGIDFNYFTKIIGSKNSINDFNIVITGNMSYRYNVSSILKFYNNVFINISNKKNIKLLLVGTNPDRKLLNLEKLDSNVIVTGRVPDIRDYINSANLIICPIFLDVGIQTKLLESMSMEKIIITTIEGIKGIGLEALYDNDSIFLSSLNIEMANLIDNLILNKIVINKNNNRQYVIDNFNWDYSSEIIKSIIES